MLRSTELKMQISAKRDELEKLQTEGDYSRGSACADELNALCDELKLELAKEKSKLENFLEDASPLSRGNLDDDSTPVGQKALATKKYRDAFFNAARKNFRNNATAPILEEGAVEKGGYLLPTSMHNVISEKLAEENVMRKLCTVIKTESTFKIPILASRPQAAWTPEKQKIDLSDEEFSQVMLDAYKLTAGVKISNELLADSTYDLEQHFVNQFITVIGNAEEDAFINGTGSGQPTGILTELKDDSDCCVEPVATTPEGGYTMDDFLKLIYSVRRPYRKNACFLTNDSTVHLLRYMKDETRNYIWQISNVAGEPDRLLGYPIYTSAFFPAAKQKSGEIVAAFGDFSKYYIGERGARQLRPLRELFALEDLTAFLMLERVDGRLIDRDAVKLLITK